MSNSINYISLKSSLNELENELSGLYYSVIQKSDKAYDKLLSKLTNSIVNTFDKQRIEAINHAIDYLSHLPSGETLSESHIQKLNEIFQSYLSIDFEDAVKENTYELGTQIYKSGFNEVSKQSGIKLSFDVTDENAADILSSHNLFYIGNYYDEHLSENLNGILKDYFTGGKTIKDVREDFYNKYSKATEKGQAYFEGLAEHTASRARELGKITGFEKAGIEYYEIRAIIDDRTSDICLSMNARIFPVTDGANLRDRILSMSSPEDIKSIAPWRSTDEVSNLHTSDLPPGLELPPYHFRCRTTAVAYPFDDFQTEFLTPPDEDLKKMDSILDKDSNYKSAKIRYSSKADSNPLLRDLLPDNLGTIINHYTSGKFNINGQSKFFEYVNKFCNNTLTNLSDDATQILSTSRNLLNIALTKLKTDFNGLVHRGVQESYDTSKYIEGKIITEEQFISASSEIESKFSGPIEFTIKSKSGKLIKEFSAFEREDEVLFRAGTKFLVTKNVLEDKIRQIEMEEI